MTTTITFDRDAVALANEAAEIAADIAVVDEIELLKRAITKLTSEIDQKRKELSAIELSAIRESLAGKLVQP